jgi:hypothetical protein
MTSRTLVLSGTMVLALGALGCASQGPKPTEEMTRARTVIEQADKGNAQRYAAADLQRAHDSLRDAEKADEARKYDDARRYAEAAEVDADVAVARGNAGEAQRAANEVRKSNTTLQGETDRNAGDAGTPIAPGTGNPVAPGTGTEVPGTTPHLDSSPGTPAGTPDSAVPR